MFLWSLCSTPNPLLFPNGLNIFILETNNDTNMSLLCPSFPIHFDIKKQTCFLLYQGNYYEPIVHFENKNKEIHQQNMFLMTNKNKQVKYVLELARSKLKYCAPKPSLPDLIKPVNPLDLRTSIAVFNKYSIKIPEPSIKPC